MKIHHLAIWTDNLELMKDFYVTSFGCTSGKKYTNPTTGFSSYFLDFTSGTKLEIMTCPGISEMNREKPQKGYAHFALSTGSEDEVRKLTEKLRNMGVTVKSEPRRTGDGYYESVIIDPDGNLIEITV